jgi:NTE family protein
VGAAAFRLAVPGASFLSSAGLRDALRAVDGQARIESLRIPLAIMAADVLTYQEVVFRSGLLWPAVLASMSIPGAYPAQRMGPYTLVDGGILNPVPSNVVAGMGADVVIGVPLVGGRTLTSVQPEAVVPAGRPPSVLEVITRSIEIMQNKISSATAAEATVMIAPVIAEAAGPGGWGLRNFSQGRRLIEAGAAATEEALPRLAAALPWLRD